MSAVLQQQTQLFVSSKLGVREVEIRPTMPPCILCGAEVFRPLTPEWYAWLRARMEKARAAHQAGRLPEPTWNAMRAKFNALHAWAVAHHGKAALDTAMNLRADPPEFLFPATGEFKFQKRVSPQAVAMVDAIRDRALALGWPMPRLYQNRGRLPFPYADIWGLVTFLGDGRRLGIVTRRHIEIINPGLHETRNRFPNMEVEQPWLKRVPKAASPDGGQL